MKKMLSNSLSQVFVWHVIALCLTLIAAAGSQQHRAPATPTTTAAVSVENAVLHFSYELERHLDLDRRPCNDFFGYVCARSLNVTKALQEQRVKQEQQRFDKFVAAENEDQLLDMELKLKQFYKTCKHARGNQALSSTPLYHNTGGWPAIEGQQRGPSRSIHWLAVLAEFHYVGASYIFETRIEMKSNRRVIHLQPDASTVRNTLRKYEQLVDEVLREYVVNSARKPLIALETLNFERNRREISKAAAAATTTAEQPLEYSYGEFKALAFGQALQLDWDVYFTRQLGKPLKPADTMIVRQLPQLIQHLELLQNTTTSRLLNWLWIDYLMDKTSNDCEFLVEKYFAPVYEHIVQRVGTDKVQMAQMYQDIGHAYDELLPPSIWIDEMSAQNSKQFESRIIHLTLNGDATLDANYKQLQIGARNFYRNLESAQRFHVQQLKSQRLSEPNAVNEMANEFMQIFRTINAVLQTQNLTTPLNFLLVGERFAERMIASGSSTHTPGAWRSMDSESEFGSFQRCTARRDPTRRQTTRSRTKSAAELSSVSRETNELLLRLLAQTETLHAYQQWLSKDVALQQRLDTLLAEGRLRLSLRKLYFVGSLLSSCQQSVGGAQEAQQQLVHNALRNTAAFTEAFGCRAGDKLYATSSQICKLL